MNSTDVQGTLRETWETRPSRPREGAEIAGVAAAVARRYALDPVLVRIGFVVSAFYGVGAVLYLAGWALLPAEPGAEDAPRRRPRPVLVVGLVVATVISMGMLAGGAGWLLPAVAVLVLLFVLHRSRAHLPAADRATRAVDASAQPTTAIPVDGAEAPRPPAWDPLGAAPFAWDLPEPTPVEPPPPSPRRAPVTAVTLGVALLAGGVTGVALLAGLPADLPVLFGVVLAVLGTGLVVGAFLRAGRGLIPVALLVGVLAWGALAAPWDRWQGEAGDIRVTPASAAAVAPVYEQPAGSFQLDLRRLDLAVPPGAPLTPVRSTIGIGAGDVRVVVPPNADVTLRAEVGIGNAEFGDRQDAGPGSALTVTDDLGADGVRSGRPIVLDIEAGVGNVEVRRG